MCFFTYFESRNFPEMGHGRVPMLYALLLAATPASVAEDIQQHHATEDGQQHHAATEGGLHAAAESGHHGSGDYTVRFDVQLEGVKELSSFLVTVREKKGALAARRFLQLVHDGFFDGCSFFRVLPGYLVQFGLSGNVTRQRAWDAHGALRDETNIEQPDWNIRGSIAFATTGPNTRGTQLFINYDDNHQLDSKADGRIVPFGRVVDGMATLSAVYAGYRERPKPSMIRARGDSYLQTEFPRLTYVVRAQQVISLRRALHTLYYPLDWL